VGDRGMVSAQMLREEAAAMMQRWNEMPDKVRY
jgi:hypothetical protein